MSRVVKSVAVVDDRSKIQKTIADVIESELNNMPVIKRKLFDYRENPYANPELVLPDKEGYIDELNRIKVEIAQAKAELRKLGRDVTDAQNAQEAALAAQDEDGLSPEELAERKMLAAQAEAERMLAETRSNVQAMMAACEEEGKRLAEEAKNNGYLEGFDKGFAEAREEFISANNPKISELDRLLEHISDYSEEMVARNERDLLELVITVAEKVIAKEVKEDARAVVNMLYQVLDQNRREENIRITVSQDLMPVEAKVAADVRKLIAQTAPNAIISVDDDAEDGTIVVETDKGVTDLSVKTQMANIKEMLQS